MEDQSFRDLISGLIDYAGLFPPAALGMAESLKLYRRYQSGEDQWMLGRFICPISKLDELGGLIQDSGRSERLIPISAILRPVVSGVEPTVEIAADAQKCASFVDQQKTLVEIGSIEAKLPDALVIDGGSTKTFLRKTADDIESILGRPLPVFWEWPLVGDFQRDQFQTLTRALSDINRSRRNEGKPAWGLKFRCGGLDQEAFPSSKTLAAAVFLALRSGVPFKATAGLHHPIPTGHSEIDVTMHGFLNLLGGAVLAVVNKLDEDKIFEILEDTSPRSWKFQDGRFFWNDISASTGDVQEARKLVTSYGSCSFDEPREDLRAMGLLEEK